MAANFTLQQYLSVRPPPLTSVSLSDSVKNTTNSAYYPAQIVQIGNWDTFNYMRMMQNYGPLLHTAMTNILPPMPAAPQPVTAEVGLRSAFDVYLKERLRSGLAFALHNARRPQGLDHLDFGVGYLARCPAKYEPDGAFFELGPLTRENIKQRVNRCPGDLKPSWKWKPSYPTHTGLNLVREGRTVLAQLNKYMNDNGTRYGYILTDEFMVAVRKRNRHGHLDLSQAIPWRAPDGNNQFGALIALWYLGMLAANAGEWRDEGAPPPQVPPTQHIQHIVGHHAGNGRHNAPSKKGDNSNLLSNGQGAPVRPATGTSSGHAVTDMAKRTAPKLQSEQNLTSAKHAPILIPKIQRPSNASSGNLNRDTKPKESRTSSKGLMKRLLPLR